MRKEENFEKRKENGELYSYIEKKGRNSWELKKIVKKEKKMVNCIET